MVAKMVKGKNWGAKLGEVKASPGEYAWGTVLKVHEVGPYGVVEYLDTEMTRPVGLGPETRYRVYVDGKHTGLMELRPELKLMNWRYMSSRPLMADPKKAAVQIVCAVQSARQEVFGKTATVYMDGQVRFAKPLSFAVIRKIVEALEEK